MNLHTGVLGFVSIVSKPIIDGVVELTLMNARLKIVGLVHSLGLKRDKVGARKGRLNLLASLGVLKVEELTYHLAIYCKYRETCQTKKT